MAAAELGFVFLVLASASALSPPKYSACDSKDFGHGGTVCVCSSEHCDGFSEGEPLASGEYAVYTSSKAGKRFHLDVGKFGEGTAADGMSPYVITVNGSARFQKILGFGGAFTGWWILVADFRRSVDGHHFRYRQGLVEACY